MIDTGVDFLWGHLFVSGLIFLIGLHFIFNQPKDTNTPTGLNFPISINPKLNLDTYTEFHKYNGKMMTFLGGTIFTISFMLNYVIPLDKLSDNQITGFNLILVQITVMFLGITVFVLTDNHMKETFDKNGNRK